MAKTDEEIARELQAMFDAEVAGSASAADEALAKRMQEELDIEDEFSEANRRLASERDAQVPTLQTPCRRGIPRSKHSLSKLCTLSYALVNVLLESCRVCQHHNGIRCYLSSTSETM
eukprot:725672-Pyramimonas_sp.AAC.1